MVETDLTSIAAIRLSTHSLWGLGSAYYDILSGMLTYIPCSSMTVCTPASSQSRFIAIRYTSG